MGTNVSEENIASIFRVEVPILKIEQVQFYKFLVPRRQIT
jgi:hypothetical protein